MTRAQGRGGGVAATAARAALEGALVWSTYGLLEQLLAWHLPALYGGEAFTSGHLRFGLWLALGYPLVGALGAGLLALFLVLLLGRRGWPHHGAPRGVAVIVLVLVVALAHLDARGRPLGLVLLGTDALLGAGALAGALAAAWSRRLAFLINAPVAAALLLAPPWIVQQLLESPDPTRERTVALFLVASVLALAFFAHARHGASRRGAQPRLDWLLRRGLGVVLAAWLLVLLAGWLRMERYPDPVDAVRGAEGGGRGPNVVLVVLDTVRADRLSLYGHERDTTPRLRALEAESLVHDLALAPGDMTLSSHASLFTGLHVRSHGAHPDVRGRGRPLPAAFETLAERFTDAGGRAAGVVANHVFFGRGYGLEQGFAALDARAPPESLLWIEAGRLPWYGLGRRAHRELAKRAPRHEVLRHYRPAAEIVAQGLELVDACAASGGPFLLLLNFMDAHWPFAPPPPWDRRFPGRDARFDSLPWRHTMVAEVVRRRERSLTPEERAHLESQYDGAIAYQDAQIGVLVDHLIERGLWDDTLLIVTSDHGEALGQRDLVGHAMGVYQDEVRVPLLIKLPRREGALQASGREAAAVSLIDVLPTVLDVLELEPPPGLHGRSLLRPLPEEPLPIVAESFPNPLGGERLDRVQRAFLVDSLKLVISTAGEPELYDLATDPDELENLFDRHPRAQELLALHEQWLQEVPEAEAGAALDDEATLERLRALGYAR